MPHTVFPQIRQIEIRMFQLNIYHLHDTSLHFYRLLYPSTIPPSSRLCCRINKLEAIMDSSAKHSPTLFEPHPVKVHHAESRRHRRSYPHPVEIAHALEAVYCSGPVGLSSAPLSPLAVKRRAASRRALPPTPPTSPTRASTAGLFQEDGA